MRIKYVGPSSAGVDIPYRDRVIRAPKGEAVEVPDDLGLRLVKQDTFERVATRKKESTDGA